MTYTNLKYINELNGIQAERTSDGVSEYFDPGSDKHKKAVSGEYGPVAAYVPPPPPTTEQIAERKSKELRRKRDGLLASSDWTQVADAPVDQAAWATYRQALRDVPQHDGFPSDVLWPEPAPRYIIATETTTEA